MDYTMESDLRGVVRNSIKKICGFDVPSYDYDLLKSGIFDSLAVLQLHMHLQKEMNTVISNREINILNYKNVETIFQISKSAK